MVYRVPSRKVTVPPVVSSPELGVQPFRGGSEMSVLDVKIAPLPSYAIQFLPRSNPFEPVGVVCNRPPVAASRNSYSVPSGAMNVSRVSVCHQ